MSFINRIIVTIAIGAVLVNSGCGVVGLLGTPARHETKVPAEYNLASQKGAKLLVLVNQPAWLAGSTNITPQLTEAVNKNLADKLNKKKEYIFLTPYEQVAGFLSRQPDNYIPSPSGIGKVLDAQLVLYIVIDDYQLTKYPENDYYRGILAGRAQLIDVDADEALWPDSANGKTIRVAFELEKDGYETAIARLAVSFAHCTVRYFYDCPFQKFKIFDDKSDAGWQQWGD